MLELVQEPEAYASALGGFGCRTLIWLGVDVGSDESPIRRALPLNDSGRTSLVNRKQVLPVFGGARVSTHYYFCLLFIDASGTAGTAIAEKQIGHTLLAYFFEYLGWVPGSVSYAALTRIAELDAGELGQTSVRMKERGPRKLTIGEKALLKSRDDIGLPIVGTDERGWPNWSNAPRPSQRNPDKTAPRIS